MIAWSKVLYFIWCEISSFFCICTTQHTPVYKEMASARPKNKKTQNDPKDALLMWKQDCGWHRHDGAQSWPNRSASGRWLHRLPLNYRPSVMPGARLFMQLCLCKGSWAICLFRPWWGFQVSCWWFMWRPETGGRIHSFVMFKGKAESLFLRPCHNLCAYQLLPVPVASIVPFACCLPKQELQTSSKHLLFYQE